MASGAKAVDLIVVYMLSPIHYGQFKLPVHEVRKGRRDNDNIFHDTSVEMASSYSNTTSTVIKTPRIHDSRDPACLKLPLFNSYKLLLSTTLS